MDIFLSYNWNIKEQVKLLHEQLENENFKVWRDDKQLHAGNSSLTAELAKSIKNSKVIICCITKDYCKSYNCNLEIQFAFTCKKQMIVLMIDKIEPNEIDNIQIADRGINSGIGFLISPLIRVNCYEKITETNTYVINPEWPHLKKDEILGAIKSCLEIVNTSNKPLQGSFNNRYKKIQEIGKGAQGIVYKVQDTLDNDKFKALKKFHQIPIELKEQIKWIIAEIKILKSISNRSDYVINYLDTFNQTFKDPDDNEYIIYYVVNNLYEDGTLEDEIENKRVTNMRLEDHDIQSWTLQLMKGIKFLHANKLIHRDLKPANIFLQRRTLVIGDLGHAKALGSNNYSYNSSRSNYSSTSNRAYGTDNYLAPETSNITEKIDIWSLGCIIYELFKLEKLFNDFNPDKLKESIKQFNVETQLNTEKIDEYPLYARLLRNCLKQIPEHRLSAEQLIDLLNGKRPDSVAIAPPRILSARNQIPSASIKPQQAGLAPINTNDKHSNLNIASIKPIESVSSKLNNDNSKSQAQEYFNKALNKTDMIQKIGFYNKAIDLDPDLLEAHKNKGDCYVNLKKYQEALECYNKIIKINLKYSEENNCQGLALKCEGLILNESKNYEEAFECFNKAIELEPDDFDSYYNREIAINELKQNSDLVNANRNKITKQTANDLDGYKKNANVLLFYLDEYKEAIEYFNKLIEINPDDSVAFNNKGLALYYLQRYEDAIQCFDDAIESNSKYTLAYYNKSMALFRLEEYQKSIDCFNQAFKLNSKLKQFTIVGKEINKLEEHTNTVYCLVLLPNNQLASGSWDNTIKIWDLNKGKEINKLEGHTDIVECLVLLPNNQLASCSLDTTIRIWDLNKGKEINKLEGHTGIVFCLVLLPNNQLASCSMDTTIRIWDLNKGKEINKLEGHTDSVFCLVLLPNNQLASCSSDTTIRIWDLNKGKEINLLEGHTKRVSCLVLLPNNQLASCSMDTTIRIWDLNKGKEINELEGHTGDVRCLVLLPNNQLASCSSDTTIRIWDLNKGKEINKLEGHTGDVYCLVLLPNNQLASGSLDTTIRIWDLNKGKETNKLEGHTGIVFCLVLLPNNQLASGSSDYTIRMWI